ncbi:hypothetical protein [cf. Phormidesmis sp. LEGE 11477]|uniref:hypothetical protein n=1 Tax=cf. Phormidesmis sp. LEGE 11477 TaxID=1828680 RepID=UPI00187F5256|nr:hypothetical protein [cf. Phormidesmis sp. LEGE 11477]MBE9061918.1 hypothetical protein [cf. Phormidesmis sp. LEGE 11477]
MSTRIVSLGVGLMLLTNALSNALSASAVPLLAVRPDLPMPSSLPGLVSRRVQLDLGRQLNVPFHTIEIEEATVQTWPDQCLGLNRPNERCVGDEVKGWEIAVSSEQRRWVYRSDRTANRLRLESLPNFSNQLSQQLLETAAKDTQQPATSLQILDIQPVVWDSGCLGISTPDVACTQAQVPGFRAIVANGPRANLGYASEEPGPTEWIYHLSEDGSQIVQNTVASETKAYVGTFFSNLEVVMPASSPFNSRIVFQSIAYSFVDGTTYFRTLTADGEVWIEMRDTRSNQLIETIMLRPVSVDEVADFEKLLTQQQFSDFDHIHYINENPMSAIDGAEFIIASRTTVGISAGERGLPDNLQAVVKAWRTIAPL